MRRCPRCSEMKPWSEFNKNKLNSHGLSTYCRSCCSQVHKDNRAKYPDRIRDQRLRKDYSLSLSEYNEKLEAQDGVCAICKNTCELGRRLGVDHDHRCCPGASNSCGECVRDLLCARCNRVIGMSKEDPELFRAMAAYVERWSNAEAH